ncbi:MAG: hypothetical protein ACYC0J_06310 [Gammaproteobacteria bacterium]
MDRTNKDESRLADHELTSGGTEKAHREGMRLKAVVFSLVKDEHFYNLLISNIIKDKKARDEFDAELQRYYQSLKELNDAAYTEKPTITHTSDDQSTKLEARLSHLIKELQAEVRRINRDIEILDKRIEINTDKQTNIFNNLSQFHKHAFSEQANYEMFDSSKASRFMSREDFRRIGKGLYENILSQAASGSHVEDATSSYLQAVIPKSILENVTTTDLTALYAAHLKQQDGYELYAQSASEYVDISQTIERDKSSRGLLSERKGAILGLIGSLNTELHTLHEHGEVSDLIVSQISAAQDSLDKRVSVELEPTSKEKLKTIDNIFVDAPVLKTSLKHYDDPFADDEPTLSLKNDTDEPTRPKLR